MSEEVLHLVIRGTVQGVGFRWFVTDEARRLGLSGWVRNNRDGSVELCARGKLDDLKELESRVRAGPSGARVSQVDRIGGDHGVLESPFSIVRG